jgi:hypothetical protein
VLPSGCIGSDLRGGRLRFKVVEALPSKFEACARGISMDHTVITSSKYAIDIDNYVQRRGRRNYCFLSRKRIGT